ncbi:hypothetical protein L3X38_011482 [Prunus dulcis]|uniref:Uncharacterized protein n=1 Tax=Prunus dulcis TaxID=3755 RepID=A0AAD4WJY1_PRUDU|nr:hypothetical protein L3X38_011482 [Prunus dulcis]
MGRCRSPCHDHRHFMWKNIICKFGLLPEALWAINTSYRRSTGETPFSLAFGTKAVVLTSLTNTDHKLSFGMPHISTKPLDITTRASKADRSEWGTGFYAKCLSQREALPRAALALPGKVPTKSPRSADRVPTDCMGPMVRPLEC